MPEPFLQLSAEDRAEALGVAATSMGRPADLLEKDVWVVWALDALFSAPFGDHLRFKGGTSLSKVYRAIARFSEDLDITYDIRVLLPESAGDDGEPLPATPSQAKKWSDRVRKLLPAWVAETALPQIQAHIEANNAPAKAWEKEGRLYVGYDRVTAAAADYVKPEVMIEFGARSAGEPAQTFMVGCDAAEHLKMLSFPRATPRVMAAERTFWEKATAMHVFCLDGRLRGERFARHWYDLVRLDEVGIAEKALADRDLAQMVAQHKRWFFEAKDATGKSISYKDAIEGSLRLMPSDEALVTLRDDYERMIDAGLVEDPPIDFDGLMRRCAALEQRANLAALSGSEPGGLGTA